ncbi:hypothetical protein FUAX_42160 (plasmid) [Fulvitalea axinellae]|uniref:MBG domain-containing protein n=2 Tax=Fulvitalea axinellae TaxID=1182444 RepID=A0AAU9CZ49_9BACT|nr:hypothetical protein FUAX_42160 [Fulvitalea axinellae]
MIFRYAMLALGVLLLFSSEAHAQNYHRGDLQALQNILNNNDPNNRIPWAINVGAGTISNTAGTVYWNTENPKRVSDLQISNKEISGVVDLRAFAKLKVFQCNENPNAEGALIDGLNNLELFYFNRSGIKSIVARNLPKLRTLNCGGVTASRVLSNVQIENLPELDDIQITYGDFSDLNLSNLPKLRRLYCSNDGIQRVALSNLPSLDFVELGNNELTSLNINHLRSVSSLYLQWNKLTTLNLDGMTNLKVLQCAFNQLTSISTAGITSMDRITINGNSLPMSRLVALPPAPYEYLLTQKDVQLASKTEFRMNSDVLDLSSEVSLEGKTTTFSWKKGWTTAVVKPSGSVDASTDIERTAAGNFKFLKPGDYTCRMTNDKVGTRYSYGWYAETVKYTVLDLDPPTMSVLPLHEREYLDVFNLNFTTNSAGAVSYTIVGDGKGATVDNTGKVTVGNLGDFQIRIDVAATGVHAAASETVQVSVKPKALDITIDPGQTQVYGPPENLKFTAPGLPKADEIYFRFSLSTLDVGDQEVTRATVVGTGNYTIKSFVPGIRKITPAPLTVTVTPGQTSVYGQAKAWQYTHPPLYQAKDALTGTLAPEQIAGAFSDAGTYTTADGSLACPSGNYTVSVVHVPVEITQAPLTITVDKDQSKIYGQADPAVFTYTTTGLVAGDAMQGKLSRATNENVGVYPIVINDLKPVKTGNYKTPVFIGESFEVKRATLKVTPEANQKKQYGEADPTLKFKVEGLAPWDSYTGNIGRIAGERAGVYTYTLGYVTPSGSPANYIRTLDPTEKFEISKAVVKIKAKTGQSKEYGEADPALLYDTEGLVAGDMITGALVRDTGDDAGKFVITQGSVAPTNPADYTVQFQPSDFEILPKKLAVSVLPNQSVVYGKTPDWKYTHPALLQAKDALTGSVSVPHKNAGSYTTENGTLTCPSGNYILDISHAAVLIKPAPLTVTPTIGQAKTYGQTDPTFTYTTMGLVGSDKLVGQLERDTGEDTGYYKITKGSLAPDIPANYTMTVVPEKFEITKADLKVVPKPGQKKVYGETDSALEYDNLIGLVAGDKMIGSLSRDSGENAGNYAITLGSLKPEKDNYNVTLQADVFKIEKAPVTVTPLDGQSKVYGESDPILDYTANGLIGTDKLNGSLKRQAGEDAGDYTILQGSLALPDVRNYTLNVSPSTFRIVKANLKVVPKSGQKKIYGESDPALEYDNLIGLIAGDKMTGALSRNPGENAGDYAFILGSLKPEKDNYNVTLQTDVFKVEKAPLTITPQAGQTKVYGSSDPEITYSVSGLVGSDKIVGRLEREMGDDVGFYKIIRGSLTAKKNTNYTVSVVPEKFEITKANLKVVPKADQSKVYGESDPVLEYETLNGLVAGDKITGFLSRNSGENAGDYAITLGSLKPEKDNYNITLQAGVFKIEKAPVTVTPLDGQSKVYGESDPTLDYAVNGLVGTDKLNGSLGRQVGEDAGDYAILQGSLSLPNARNYTLNFSPSTFHIAKADLKVVPKPNQKKVYGESDPALEYDNLIGLVAGDNMVGELSRNPGENAGDYVFTLGSLKPEKDNYNITLQADVFKIEKAPLKITPKVGQTKVYGQPDPAFEFDVTGLVGSDKVRGNIRRESGEDAGQYNFLLGSIIVDNSDNYTLQFDNTDFKIIPAPVTVTPDSKLSKIYGDVDPELAYQTTGLLGDDRLYGELGRVVGENAGTYAINLGSLSGGKNYSLTLENGAFKITPRPMNITIRTGQQKIYGDNDPTFEYDAEGLVSGDNMAGRLERHEGEDTGVYPIKQGSLKPQNAGNYTVKFVSGDFNITPAPLTIGVYDEDRRVIDPNPEFEIYYEGFKSGDDEKVLTKIPVATTTATEDSDPGIYPISISEVSSKNYIIQLKSGVLTILDREPLDIPTLLTPNGDGMNDNWNILNLEYYDWVSVKIYTGAGKVVFFDEKYRYEEEWNPKDLDSGTYAYTVETSEGNVYRGRLIIRK